MSQIRLDLVRRRQTGRLELRREIAALQPRAREGAEERSPHDVAAFRRDEIGANAAERLGGVGGGDIDRDLLVLTHVGHTLGRGSGLKRLHGDAIGQRLQVSGAAAVHGERCAGRDVADGAADVRRADVDPGNERRHERGHPVDGQRVQRLSVQHALAPDALHVHDRRFTGHGDGFLQPADPKLRVDRSDKVAAQRDPLASHGREPGQHEGDGVDAGTQVLDPVSPGAVVTAVRTFSISAGLAASTVTPGSTAPDVSATVPAIDACAYCHRVDGDDAGDS